MLLHTLLMAICLKVCAATLLCAEEERVDCRVACFKPPGAVLKAMCRVASEDFNLESTAVGTLDQTATKAWVLPKVMVSYTSSRSSGLEASSSLVL